jgi:hypothetical protein
MQGAARSRVADEEGHKTWRVAVAGVTLSTIPTSVSRLFTQCGIHNISQPYTPAQPITEISILSDVTQSLFNRSKVFNSRVAIGFEKESLLGVHYIWLDDIRYRI